MNIKDFNKYFNHRKPIGSVLLLIVGVLFFLMGASFESYGVIVIGMVCIGTAVHLFVKWVKVSNDIAVDNSCKEKALEYFSQVHSAVKTNNTDVIESVCSSGYTFENIFQARRAIKGKDNIWRSSIYKMQCLFLTQERIYFYSKKFSLITEERTETKKDFMYSEIQMIYTEETNGISAVVFKLLGNEEIKLSCDDREKAQKINDFVKSKMN